MFHAHAHKNGDYVASSITSRREATKKKKDHYHSMRIQ